MNIVHSLFISLFKFLSYYRWSSFHLHYFFSSAHIWLGRFLVNRLYIHLLVTTFSLNKTFSSKYYILFNRTCCFNYVGVHGALMVYEPRFTADLLATLLSIPPSKTLLRRHLSTHFKDLVGRHVIGEKREAEATPGYVPLSATSKVKVIHILLVYLFIYSFRRISCLIWCPP